MENLLGNHKSSNEFIVKELVNNIKTNLPVDVWEKFEEEKTDRGRIELLFERKKEIREKVKNHLQLHCSTTRKDKSKAMILKGFANAAFGAGEDEKALWYYSQALAFAEMTDAAVLYANRSAALFHLNEFSLAEKDAELAFSLKYPNELHYKLYERLGRCCLQKGNTSDAVKKFQQAIKALEMSKLDEPKTKKTKKTLEELIKSSVNSSQSFFQNPDGSLCASAGSQENSHSPTIPEIVGGRNSYLKAATSRITLQYREKQGRFAIANETILPGDVILVEKAYVSVLLPENYHRQCFQCYAPLRAPVVCEHCVLVSFCSKECRDKAWRTHHKYECGILGLLKYSGISVICYMALRILTQSDAKEVLGWYELACKTEEEEISKSQEKVSAEKSNNYQDKMRKGTLETLGFNEEYRTDHVALFHLVTHSQRRRPGETLHQIVMTLYLLQALKFTSFFNTLKSTCGGSTDKEKKQETSVPTSQKDEKSENISKNNGATSQDELTKASISQNTDESCTESDISKEIEIEFAVLILRFLKALQFNTHETAGWNPDVEKNNSVALGGGLFPTLALFNHSCNPGIVRYFVNDSVVVRAIKTILPCEPVTENYGQNYSNVPRDERQAKLLDYYWFQCDCIACREDWATFETMSKEMMSFRCEHCRTFICKADDKMGILFRCGKCSKSVNILKSLKALHESEGKYNKAVKFIDNGELETGLGLLLENLTLLDTYLMPPFRDYHICQEYIRRCFLNQGLRISKLPFWDPQAAIEE